jgi:hypothetical protein
MSLPNRMAGLAGRNPDTFLKKRHVHPVARREWTTGLFEQSPSFAISSNISPATARANLEPMRAYAP